MSSTETATETVADNSADSKADSKADSDPTEPPFATFPAWIIQASRQYYPSSPCVDYGLLKVVKESQHLSLLPHQIPSVVNAFARLGKLTGAIIDATAHVGCSALLFELLYPESSVVAVESDPQIFAALQHNLKACRSRVIAVRADCTRYLFEAHVGASQAKAPAPAALVYFDPPWGGEDYRRARSVSLELGGRPISEVISRALELVAPLVVLKAPNNIDATELRENVKGALTAVVPIVRSSGKNRGEAIYRLLVFRRGGLP